MMTRHRNMGSLACALLLFGLVGCGEPTQPEEEQPPPEEPRDVTPPTVAITGPAADALIVDRQVPITISANDSVGVTSVDLSISGTPFDVDLAAPWEFAWNNDGYAEGDYVLRATAHDAAGNAAVDEVTVRLRDLVFVTEIEVTNTTDGMFDTNLEVEVHLYDADDGSYLGCTGAQSGMAGVNGSDVRYPLQAFFQSIEPDVHVILLDDIAQRNLKLRVIEDDLLPCPEAGPGGLDDSIGTFEPLPASDLSRPLSFDNVVYLTLGSGRRG